MYLEKENSDFLETYSTITNFYTTFSILIVITLKQLINHFSSIQKGSQIVWPQGPQLFLDVLLFLMVLGHLLQFLAVNLQLFIEEKKRVTYRFVLSVI